MSATQAQSLNDIRTVRSRMDTLHRGNDTHTAEPGNIIGVQVLRMFNSPTEFLAVGNSFESSLENVEHFTIRSVADRVDTELIIVFQTEPSCFLQRLCCHRIVAQ